jgi:GT2 family glycosyltransferase
MDLAVIIINWNTRVITLDALRSLYADVGETVQVWVLDNASSDGSAEAIRQQFPQVRLIASDTNLGFAGGNNAVMREIGFPDGDNLPAAVYLLNSDTITHKGATQTLYDALFSLPDAGVVGARLTYGDGSFQHSAFAFPDLLQLWIDLFPVPGRLYDSALNGRYSHQLYAGDQPFPVDHTLGATMMLKSEVIQQTGMFDEQFHMYCEEVDWSWRIQQAGWNIYCIPAAHVTHLGGQSTGQVKPRSIINLWTSRLQLFEKYYPAWKRSIAHWLVRRGMHRQIQAVQNDTSLTDADRLALIDAYQTVIDHAS